MSNYYDEQLKKMLHNVKGQTSSPIGKKASELSKVPKEFMEQTFSNNMINATKKYQKIYGFDS